MRKKIINLFALSLLLLGITAGQASALTFYLDQVINGGPPIKPVASFGTITLTDVTGGVLIDVVLNNATQNLHGFALNYNDSYFNPRYDKFTLSNGVIVSVKENNIPQDGFKGMLDIEIPDKSTLGNGSSFHAILKDSIKDLKPEDFDFTDTLGYIFASAHVGNIGAKDDSLWLGADKNPPPPVPEPGTMMLLGAGFLGLAIYGKRRNNA